MTKNNKIIAEMAKIVLEFFPKSLVSNCKKRIRIMDNGRVAIVHYDTKRSKIIFRTTKSFSDKKNVELEKLLEKTKEVIYSLYLLAPSHNISIYNYRKKMNSKQRLK